MKTQNVAIFTRDGSRKIGSALGITSIIERSDSGTVMLFGAGVTVVMYDVSIRPHVESGKLEVNTERPALTPYTLDELKEII